MICIRSANVKKKCTRRGYYKIIKKNLYFIFSEKDNEFTMKLEQLIEEANEQRCILVDKVTNDELSEMEKLTKILNTSNCYHQVLKEHLKFMYNQLKYLTANELQKQNSQLNKQLV